MINDWIIQIAHFDKIISCSIAIRCWCCLRKNLWFTENRMWMRVMPPKFLGCLESRLKWASLSSFGAVPEFPWRWSHSFQMFSYWTCTKLHISSLQHLHHLPKMSWNWQILTLKSLCQKTRKPLKNSQGPWELHSCSGAGSSESQISDSQSQVGCGGCGCDGCHGGWELDHPIPGYPFPIMFPFLWFPPGNRCFLGQLP